LALPGLRYRFTQRGLPIRASGSSQAGQIRAAFVGKVFSDDTHFSNRFKADGTIDGVSMGKKISNKWKLDKDTLCINDSMYELCYAVWIKGRDVQLVYEDKDVILSGSIK
jgi:hypothetical protein